MGKQIKVLIFFSYIFNKHLPYFIFTTIKLCFLCKYNLLSLFEGDLTSIYYKLTYDFIVINTIVLFIVIKTKITIIFYRKLWLTYCIFVNAASKYMMCT